MSRHSDQSADPHLLGGPLRRAYGAHPCQFGDFYPAAGGPATQRGVLVVVHGGFWRPHRGVEMTAPLCAHLAHQGWYVWNVEYRRVGQGDWKDTLHDCAAAVRHVDALTKEFDVRPATVRVIGHSAGGQLAVWAAGHAQHVREVVSLAGILDLDHAARTQVGDGAVVTFLGGPPDTYPDRYAVADPMRHPRVDATVHCVHAETDERVPFDLSQRYARAAHARGDNVRLIPVTGTHTDLIDPHTQAWREAARHIGFLRPAGLTRSSLD